MTRQRFGILIMVAVVGMTSVASARTCYYKNVDNNVSGDALYGARICRQWLIDKWWRDFNFDKGDWDNGFGYHDPCNIQKPLARTFNGLHLLLFSAPDPALSRKDFDGSFLRWAYNYSADKINELDGRCGDDPGTLARTQWGGWIFVDDWTKLYWPFFYDQGVPERAGTIVHEARHADGKGHDGGSGCPRGGSCDKRWTSYGANFYQVLYLWWFRVAGANTTTAMKERARDRAQLIIDQGFNEHPGIVIP